MENVGEKAGHQVHADVCWSRNVFLEPAGLRKAVFGGWDNWSLRRRGVGLEKSLKVVCGPEGKMQVSIVIQVDFGGIELNCANLIE